MRGLVGKVFKQEEPANIWEFSHDLGTTDLLLETWVSDERQDADTFEISEQDIKVEFREPCTGTLCLLDPAHQAECTVYIRQIADWPDTFPPSSHTHDRETVLSSRDSEALGTQPPSYYLNVSQLGINLPPLGPDGRVPLQYLPTGQKIHIADAEASMQAARLLLDSGQTPIHLQRDFINNTAVISMQPVVQNIHLSGNVTTALLDESKVISAVHGFKMFMVAGAGIRFNIQNEATVEVEVTNAISKKYTHPEPLIAGASWTIDDTFLGEPGNHTFYVQEILPGAKTRPLPIGDPLTAASLGIKLTCEHSKLIVNNGLGRVVAGLIILATGDSQS